VVLRAKRRMAKTITVKKNKWQREEFEIERIRVLHNLALLFFSKEAREEQYKYDQDKINSDK